LRPERATSTNGFCRHESLRDLADAFGIGRGGFGYAQLIHSWKLRALHLVQGHLARQLQINRPAGLGARHLQRARDHQSGVVLQLHAMVPLGVLPHDAVLVEALLQPDMPAAVARAREAAGIARR
jgi:hypothetical protein